MSAIVLLLIWLRAKSSVRLSKPKSIDLGLLASTKFDDIMCRTRRINTRVWRKYGRIDIPVGWICDFPLEVASFKTYVALSESRILSKHWHR